MEFDITKYPEGMKAVIDKMDYLEGKTDAEKEAYLMGYIRICLF